MTYQLIGKYAVLSDREGTPLRDRVTFSFPMGGVLVVNGNLYHSEKGHFTVPRKVFSEENTLRFHTAGGTCLCEEIRLAEGKLIPAGMDTEKVLLTLFARVRELENAQTELKTALREHESRLHAAELFG